MSLFSIRMCKDGLIHFYRTLDDSDTPPDLPVCGNDPDLDNLPPSGLCVECVTFALHKLGIENDNVPRLIDELTDELGENL